MTDGHLNANEADTRRRLFQAVWYWENILLILSILVAAYSAVWVSLLVERESLAAMIVTLALVSLGTFACWVAMVRGKPAGYPTASCSPTGPACVSRACGYQGLTLPPDTFRARA